MKYAFFPGCVSKGGCPELYQSVKQVYPRLGIDLEEMTTASCTGAGVLQERICVWGHPERSYPGPGRTTGTPHHDDLQYVSRRDESGESSADDRARLSGRHHRVLAEEDSPTAALPR